MESKITERLIGVEAEAIAPIIGTGSGEDVQRLLASVLSNQGIRAIARGYSQQPLPNGTLIAVEHDSSLRDESRYAGLRWSRLEIKTMPMTFARLQEVLPNVLEIVKYCGARVNYSCGLHVHHHLPEAETNTLAVRSLQHLWWRFHKVIYGLVAPSRIANNYCRPPEVADAKRYDECSSYSRLCQVTSHTDRYSGLNLSNLANRDRMTVEWRIHHGTLEWEKIKGWVLATQRWVEHSVSRSCHYKPDPMPNSQDGLNNLLLTTGLKPNSRIYRKVDKELRQVGKYLLRRWKHFTLPREFKNAAATAA